MAVSDRQGVFISWSKPVSAGVATHLKPFLEDVLGTAIVFMSQAMEGGARWAMEIPQHLEACNAGLVLVTRENRHEPWLHFEAGALSKHIDESRVVPLLCGASVGDIQGTPLSLFQAKSFNHDEFLSVCIAFGASFGVAEEAVRRRFDKSWTDLEATVLPITQKNAGPEKELGLPDLMAVVERLASQVTGIEAILKAETVRSLGILSSRRNTLLRPISTKLSGVYPNYLDDSHNEELFDILYQYYLQQKDKKAAQSESLISDEPSKK
jgi:hypothetical protein